MKKIIKILLYTLILLAAIIFLLETFYSYTPSKTIHKDAPVKTKQSIRIHAPVQTVYRVFAEVNKWPEWQKEISAAHINGRLQPGSIIDWETGGLTIRSTLQIVKPDTIIGWSGKAFGSFAIHVWHFEQNQGYTTVTVEESMEGWLVSLLTGYFQSHLEPATQHWLNALKVKSE